MMTLRVTVAEVVAAVVVTTAVVVVTAVIAIGRGKDGAVYLCVTGISTIHAQ